MSTTPKDQNVDLLGDSTEFTPPPLPRAPDPDRYKTVVILPPDPRQFANDQKIMKAWTQNQIRKAFHQLAAQNLDAVQTWLHRVAEDSPSKAVELFIELAKFSLPQLKETAVNVTTDKVTRTFTSSADILAELNSEK